MKIRYFLISILFIGLCNLNLMSKEETSPIQPIPTLDYIYLGLTAGYNNVIHTANLKTFAYDNICPSFEDGNASGFHAGIFYEQFIGEIGTAHSIILRLLYNTYPTDFNRYGDRWLSRVIDPTKDTSSPDYAKDIYTTTGHRNSVEYNAVSADLMYKFRFINLANIGGLVATVGPTVDYIITKTRVQSMYITDPSNVQFSQQTLNPGQSYSPDRRTLYAYDGEIENAKSIRFGIKAGIQLEFNIPGFPLQLIPGVFYNYGLTDVNDQDWKVHVIQPSIDIRIPIGY